MAIDQYVGNEAGDLTEYGNTTGTVGIISSPVHTGNYALQCNPTTTALGAARLRGRTTGGAFTNTGAATRYYEGYFRIVTLPASGDEEFFEADDTSGVGKLFGRISSGGTLGLYDSALNNLGAGSTVLSTGTWYRIGVMVGTGASAAYELRIGGATELSGSTANLGTSNNGGFWCGKHNNRNGNTVDFIYDDWHTDSADWPGDKRVARMDVDGNGTYVDWVGNSTDVDDVPHDSDTTYVTDGTVNSAESFTLESATSAGISGTVHAVMKYAIIRDEGGVSSVAVRLRSSTTDEDTANNDPGSSYVSRAEVHTTDPATGAAWLLAALDSIEVGVVCNAAIDVRCTMACAMVSYTPAAFDAATFPHPQSARPVWERPQVVAY